MGWDDVAQVIARVREEAGHKARRAWGQRRQPARPKSSAEAVAVRPDPRDPTLWPQREALKGGTAVSGAGRPIFDTLTVESFTHPGYAAVRVAIEAAGGTSSGISGGQWIDAVREQSGSPARRA